MLRTQRRAHMIDVKTADRELQTYIRPHTFPVAIRMLKPGEPIPERARRPARDFKKLSMSCQVIDMARRYGWMIALTREDHICSLGITAIGFDKPLPIYNVGTLCEGMYTETKEAGQRSEAAIDKFAPGEYETLLVAPLDRATFEPQDRKSTRLNSSHRTISYAVFCLKKKKTTTK